MQVKIKDTIKNYDKVLVKVSQVGFISVTTYQKVFIFGPQLPWMVAIGWHSGSDSRPQGLYPGLDWSKYRTPLKVVF